MPRKAKKAEDPDNLKSFFNNFHKEIGESSDDKVVNKIMKAIDAEEGDLTFEDDTDQEEDKAAVVVEDEDEEEEFDEDKYFIDDEGNCYIKTTPKKQKELQEKLKEREAEKPGKNTRSATSKATNKAINLRPAKSPPKGAASKTTPEPKPISVRPARAAAARPKPVEMPPPPAPKPASTPVATPKRGRPRKIPLVPKSETIDLEREIEELVDDPNINATGLSDLTDYTVDSAAVEADNSVLRPNEDEVYEFEDNAAVESAEEPDDKQDLDFVLTGKQLKLKSQASPAKQAGVKQYSCSQCSYTSNKKFLITRHCRTHDVEPAFKCSICERSFRSNVGLVNHTNTHLGKKPHKCKYCENAFTTSGELIRHTRYKHTKEKPHKCTECSYASVELTKLRRHMTCHTGERPYQCPHCTYASQDMFKLKRHLVIHTGEKKYQCDICKSRFTQSNSLKAHKLIHSVVDKPVFQCTLCPTTCGRKADLRIHIKHMHTSEQPLTCRRCGQELPDRYQYKLHVKSHEGEKCYRCSLCSYASVTQRHLDSHMLIHLDEKPFQCEHCPMAFRQRQLLRRHINLLHDAAYQPPQPRAKVHQCPSCPRSFTHKGNLMRHMELHDNSVDIREKQLQLKMGRNLRLKKDGTIVKLVKQTDLQSTEEPVEEDNPESYDLAEIVNTDEEDGDVEFIATKPKPKPVIINKQAKSQAEKGPVIINKRLRTQTGTKTFHIKEEPNNSDFTLELQGDDGQLMVVELVNGDEDVVVKREPSATNKISATNCFGFEEDDDYEEYDAVDEVDEASQEFLQLMDMIEQDT
ncbi:transcriptional repressor CTCF [Drosophila kikkawai]|uniref:Zinc finger protein 135 n=1 Tax=Drosophila kikkawai TaxID=30033 RepID=A0A6P4JN48_DROKI|nr:zinc finger protein 135 [Drosophila kikkawai]XP_017036104.1 zinc finger protein 135 [Drosophila kikkawai]